jgi:phosphatidate cytidylyltransferase
MPLNLQTFKTRAITALFFVVIMLAGLLVNYYTFIALILIIHIGCWVEYQKLVALIDNEYAHINQIHKVGVIVTGIGFVLWMLPDAVTLGNFHFHEMGWWILIIGAMVLPVQEVLLSKKHNANMLLYSFIGLVYISLSAGLLMHLYYIHAYLPLLIIACMWVNDTMAYLVGSFIGKTPFSSISPKKTWEGTIGGILLCTVVVGFLATILFQNQWLILSSQYHFYIIAFIAAITGTAGDLLESKIKRMANVKDSGSLMPGHGGFLDRFDSLLVAVPFVWLYIYFSIN